MKQTLHPIKPLFFVCTFLSLFFLADAQKSAQQVQDKRNKILSDPKVALANFSATRQTPSLIKLTGNAVKNNDGEIKSALVKYLNIRPAVDNLVQTKKAVLPGDISVLEYQQLYKGVKVDRAGYKALSRAGEVSFLSGAFYDVPATLSIAPRITEKDALMFAKRLVNAKKYAWEQLSEDIAKSSNTTTRKVLTKELNEYLPKGELVIIKDFTKKDMSEMRLAYKFNIYASQPLSRGWVYVDAENGKILLYDKIIKHVGEPTPDKATASSNATVQTRYAGTQVIKTKQISGNDPNSGAPIISSHPTTEPSYIPGSSTYALIDDTRGNGIETYDLNNVGGVPVNVSALYLQGRSFTDVDNNWTFSQHHRSAGNDGAMEAENDDIAWDAHWGAEVVYDYWLAKHNRLSYDGKDAKIYNYIHYGPAYDNAFWNGTAMTYGDGSGTTALGFKALTSLDVCGHEIGHGVCSSTSDLIYQGESGAMNEGLSDIWAACVEYFSMTRSGSTVPSTAYRPFYIGEQIGADYNSPLRRMDNTKQQSNPDTYGGTYWVEPNCTPNTANDQCGVHTNSGVINKWFFLITAGSKTGTRPAGFITNQYYFADSDDELNDQGETYKVNGVGFSVAENLTFMMETMLSADATYAEARDISIQAAISISGDACSALVETVTNAWYAVGVGNQFVKPCAITYGFSSKAGLAVNEASGSVGCTAQKTYTIPVLLPANSSATITASGSAQAGLDYSFSPASLTNAGSSSSRQTVTVTIKNDAVVETDETIGLTVAVTNTGTAPVNKTYAVTIMDDDVKPVIGAGEKTLLDETFTRADGFADPTGWVEKLEISETSGDPMATGKNQWGVFSNKLAITGKEGTTNVQLPKNTYNSNSESQTVIRSKLIDARGLSRINLKFDYKVQGEVDVAAGSADVENLPVFDYMAIAYSLDGVSFVELNTNGFKQFASVLPDSGTFTASLPVSLGNRQFYLAFRWSNDTNGGGPQSVSIDNLIVKGSPRSVDNTSKANGKENVGPAQEVYFYSILEGDLLGKIKNNSSNNFGCTNMILEKSGVSARDLYKSADSIQKVAGKIMQVQATSNFVASTTVTLYFDENILKALEQATGKSRTSFSVYRVYSSAFTGASAANTKRSAATYTAISGVGGSFTTTFSDNVSASYAIGASIAVPSHRGVPEFSIGRNREESNADFGIIYPNPGNGEALLKVSVPQQEHVKIDVINIYGQTVHSQSRWLNAGINQVKFSFNKFSNGKYLVNIKNGEGRIITTQSYVKQ